MGIARRLMITLVCALGFVVALLAYWQQWSYSEFPPGFALQSLAYPARVENDQATTPEHLRFLAESWPPGTTITILDHRGMSHESLLVLRQGRTALVLTGLSGLVFLASAIFFFAPRCGRPGLGGFFWISLLYGLSIMVGGVFWPRTNTLLITLLDLIQIACLAALPAIFVHLALTFPRRAEHLDRWRWIVPALGVCAGAVFTWQVVVLLRFVSSPTLIHGRDLRPAFATADIFMVALTLAGVVIIAVRSRRLEMTRERNQSRWLLWGFAIGAAPYVLLRSLPALVGLPLLMPDHVDRVVEMAIPLAFVMAVVRHQFLDIDVIIRRSLLYFLLAAALVGVNLVAAVVFGRSVEMPQGIDPWIPPVILGLAAGMAIVPLRRVLGRWIDRTFFKLNYDLDQHLDQLDHRLSGLAGREQLAEVLQGEIKDALGARSSAVVFDGDEGHLVCGDITENIAAEILEDADHGRAQDPKLLANLRTTSRPDLETADFPTALKQGGLVLAHPLVIKKQLGGWLLVGERVNERRYVKRDLDFLAGCARCTTQHLERIALMQKVAEETLARQHFAELEQLKSEFLAHVAHDLRTPVTGITWSARNLRDGLAGSLTAPQAEYVDSIAQSGDHLNRLVSNLLEVSRLERAQAAIDFSTVDSWEVWSQAIKALQPLAITKKVTLTTVGVDHAVPVRANGDKLTEVAVNLLDNAVKYTAPDSEIMVVFHEPEAGKCTVTVKDQGPGFGDQTPDDLFTRFSQGTPSPSSNRKGFGLGLHIAATYLDMMDGSLTAANHPAGGAVFTCRLPLAELRGDEA